MFKLVLLVFILIGPTTWIRKLERLRAIYIVGVSTLLLFSLIIITYYAFDIQGLSVLDSGQIMPFENRAFQFYGMSYFYFSGIVNLLPIMNSSDVKTNRNFTGIFAVALLTIFILYSAYAYSGLFSNHVNLSNLVIIKDFQINNSI